MAFQKITLIGIGLLGGSLGLAVQQRKLASRIEGYARRAETVAECDKLGIVDRATCDLKSAVTDADLVVLCTPIAQMRELTQRMLPELKPGAIVTDVGSVKGTVVAQLEPLCASVSAHFVGSHPMAGGEKMGVSAARPDLYENAICVVTPTPRSDAAAFKAVEAFWRAVGMRILMSSPDLHDQLVSRSSHLPHVVAAQLAMCVLDPAHPREQASVCATGFRDTTRIASGSPEMWRDIALANQKNLSDVLGMFIDDLQQFRRVLDSGDARAIEQFFAVAKQRRDSWRAQASPSNE